MNNIKEIKINTAILIIWLFLNKYSKYKESTSNISMYNIRDGNNDFGKIKINALIAVVALKNEKIFKLFNFNYGIYSGLVDSDITEFLNMPSDFVDYNIKLNLGISLIMSLYQKDIIKIQKILGSEIYDIIEGTIDEIYYAHRYDGFDLGDDIKTSLNLNFSTKDIQFNKTKMGKNFNISKHIGRG